MQVTAKNIVILHKRTTLKRNEALCTMNRVTQTLVWIRRISHCRGFGIQSPTDYSFVRDVVNEQRPYYTYSEVGQADEWLRRKLGHLYLRLANHVQPEIIADLAGYADYLHAGCRQAQIITPQGSAASLVEGLSVPETRSSLIIAHPNDANPTLLSRCKDKTVLVVEDIGHHKQQWKMIEQWPSATITFDLYYCGIATFNPQRAKQHYIVNF